MIVEINNGIKLNGISDFNTCHIMECGQCFRWEKETDGSYTIVAYGKVINVYSEGDTVIIKNTNRTDFENIWKNYFDLNTDYSVIKKAFSQDSVLYAAMDFGYGIRILKQEPFEIILSFIISANNNIPRIKKIINTLCENYGEPIMYAGKTYYSFPKIERIAMCSQEEIDICRAGFRNKYLYKTINMINNNEINIKKLADMDSDMLKKQLLTLSGVGPKVADCIKLFAFSRVETYPIDVWVKKVTEHYYLKKEVELKDIAKFATQKFGKYAGYAQQYLFYYVRERGLL